MKMRRESCRVCNEATPINWRTREMDKHRRSFPAAQKTLLAMLSNFDLDDLGSEKYGKRGEEVMQGVVALNGLLKQ